tara:strand:- start:383 stop:694 length:312 start_codon:yes stop_codon:yes gene_type:complete
MKYSDKLNKSKELLDSIYSLKDQEELSVTYGVERYDNKPREFRIKCYKNYRGDGFHYSIWEVKGLGGMNIDKIGRTTMKGYTFDMMSQKTTYVFPLYKMKIVK